MAQPSATILKSDPPRVYKPRVAAALGSLTDAVVLQQFDYWLDRSTKQWGGYTWVYKTRHELAGDLGITEGQIRGAFDRLRARGLLVSIRNPGNGYGFDRTLWWRIDYKAVDAFLAGVPEPGELDVPDDRLPTTDRLDSRDQSIGSQKPKLGWQRPSNTREYEPEITTEITPDTTATTDARGDDSDQTEELVAYDRLQRFVDAKIAAGLGKAEYREEDLAKPEWLAAFRSLNCSEEDFEVSLNAAMTRADTDWLRRMRGANAAQAFVGHIASLRPARHRAYDLPSVI